MNSQSIAERLKYHRKINGLTQEELSEKTNVTVRTIQRIENSDVTPHLKTVKLLAIALDIEVDDLLPLSKPEEDSNKKKWLLILHATPLLGLFLPPCNVLIPLFLWLHKKDENPAYNEHGIKVINFQITAIILAFLSFVSLVTIEGWGFFIFISTVPILIGIVLFNIIYVLRKEKCNYLFSIPFLRIKSTKILNASIIFMLLCGFSSCTTNKSQDIERIDGTKISKDSITQKINQLIDDANVHGMAIAIFNENQPVYQNVVGYKDFPKKLMLTDSTNIYGASLSKAVFSVLAMKLVEHKVIDLDTPLESYLPKKIYEYEPQTRWHDDYSDLRQDSLYHKITARMCLEHTTGFANWRFFEADKKLRVNNIPGTKYGYSGEGFVYLQVVLEKLTGKDLEQLAQELIFQPLKMKNSSYQWLPKFEKDFAYGHMKNGETYAKDTDNEPRSGSTLETTASDYIKFLTAVLNQEILTKASYDEMFSPQIRIKSLTHFGPNAAKSTNKYDNINLSSGLGWHYLETPFGRGVSRAGHGNGFQHYSILFPYSGKGILIMTNSDNGESIYKELLEYTIADKYTPWEWSNFLPHK